jgi:acyl carrier protein
MTNQAQAGEFEGKTDHEGDLCLGSGQHSGDGQGEGRPATELERAVARIWETALERQHIGLQELFFDLGGHSLSALEVVTAIERQLGLECSLQLMMNNPSIEALSKFLSEVDHDQEWAGGN